MRTLIAEDDPISRRLLEAVLSKWGYEVIVASNGLEAWQILNCPDPPRLAILDWMMPGVDGIEICRRVREQRPTPYVYIILLTAKNRRQDTIEGLSAGADDFIGKPFETEELKARLNTGIRILKLQAELLSAQETLRLQATRDSLTGLPNRLLFGDRLAHDLAQARRRDEQLAVMFLDLDNFKFTNDTLGHGIGDALLRSVAERLVKSLREVDTIARMGGDEFTIILTDVRGIESVEKVAEKALAVFAEPFLIEGHEIIITPSIGISIYPIHGSDAESLVKNADAAMYRAKEKGKNNYSIYSEALNVAAMERMSIARSLREAIDKNEFVLHYQPRLSINTGRILGVEALIRWKHPVHGIVPPAEFIPFAEESGLIVPIEQIVLRTACVQNKTWQDAGIPPINIAVNISASQFHRGELQNTVKEILTETGLEPGYLGLELTESTLMQNLDKATGILNELRAMGVKLSLDDFGTGYSSISYLKRFPIDAVKLDQSFVKEITTNTDDAAIAEAVITMAHSMKLKVIAEGVETLEQLEFLRSLGCDEMQGYFVSRPVTAEECELLLHRDYSERLGVDVRAA